MARARGTIRRSRTPRDPGLLASVTATSATAARVVPAAFPGSVGMLHDYIRSEERLVACPNLDAMYWFAAIDRARGPSIVQVPDFGGRFCVYQVCRCST